MSSGATGASSGSGSRWPACRGQHGKQPIEIVVHRSADEDPASHAFGEARRGDCVVFALPSKSMEFRRRGLHRTNLELPSARGDAKT